MHGACRRPVAENGKMRMQMNESVDRGAGTRRIYISEFIANRQRNYNAKWPAVDHGEESLFAFSPKAGRRAPSVRSMHTHRERRAKEKQQ